MTAVSKSANVRWQEATGATGAFDPSLATRDDTLRRIVVFNRQRLLKGRFSTGRTDCLEAVPIIAIRIHPARLANHCLIITDGTAPAQRLPLRPSYQKLDQGSEWVHRYLLHSSSKKRRNASTRIHCEKEAA